MINTFAAFSWLIHLQLFLKIYLFHFSYSEKETKLDYSRQQQYKRFNKWFDDFVAWTWRGKAVRNSDSLLISLFSIFLKHLPTIMNSHQGIDYDSYLSYDSYLRFRHANTKSSVVTPFDVLGNILKWFNSEYTQLRQCSNTVSRKDSLINFFIFKKNQTCWRMRKNGAILSNLAPHDNEELI